MTKSTNYAPPARRGTPVVENGRDGTYPVEFMRPAVRIQAETDSQAIDAWIGTCDSRHTTIAYRKEAERFVAWLDDRGKDLRSLKMEDITGYNKFLGSLRAMQANDPIEAKKWMSGTRHHRSDDRWRPFVKPLSLTSQRQAFLTITIFLRFLEKTGYTFQSPVDLVAVKKAPKSEVKRWLPWSSVEYLYLATDQLPERTTQQRKYKARARFMVALFTQTAARISDLPGSTMDDIAPDQKGYWWWSVMGKGNKPATLPVTSVLLTEFKRYKQALADEEAAPVQKGTARPLVESIRGKSLEPISEVAIYNVMKKVMEIASSLVPPDQSHVADYLKRATPHWLRHTALSRMVAQKMDMKTVQENGRHEDINTTMGYIHVKQEDRHKNTDRALNENELPDSQMDTGR